MVRLIGIGDNVVDCNYTTQTVFPGGNCVNFAVFGRQLGHETAYVGMIARDFWGDVILNSLVKNRVDVSQCVIEDGETGRCGIHLKDGDRVIVDENDAGLVKAHPLVITDEILEFIKTFDVAHSSCYSYIEGELHKIKEAGIPLVYDFSDEWTEDTLKNVCPDIDIAFFSGKDLPDEELKAHLKNCVREYGCSLAITTIGGRGAIVYNGRRYYQKEPYTFQGGVRDTTGAGDSWLTGFISAYADHMNEWKRLKERGSEDFVTDRDYEDYEDCLIEFCMCSGNLLARRNCLVEGSYGFGIAFPDSDNKGR